MHGPNWTPRLRVIKALFTQGKRQPSPASLRKHQYQCHINGALGAAF